MPPHLQNQVAGVITGKTFHHPAIWASPECKAKPKTRPVSF
jgi:hypothetical protein